MDINGSGMGFESWLKMIKEENISIPIVKNLTGRESTNFHIRLDVEVLGMAEKIMVKSAGQLETRTEVIRSIINFGLLVFTEKFYKGREEEKDNYGRMLYKQIRNVQGLCEKIQLIKDTKESMRKLILLYKYGDISFKEMEATINETLEATPTDLRDKMHIAIQNEVIDILGINMDKKEENLE